MSAANVELVRRLLDMFAKRDHEAVFAFYDPDIEWDAAALPGRFGVLDDLAGVYHGHEGVRTYWRRWLQAWKDIEFELEDVLDAGDHVVALIRNQRQWGRHSGIVTDMAPRAGLHRPRRQGRAVALLSRQEPALAAVGLTR